MLFDIITNGHYSCSMAGSSIHIAKIPDEMKEQDLRDLFEKFGEIKDVRIPEKNGSRRGYGFVDFISDDTAKKVVDAEEDFNFGDTKLEIEMTKDKPRRERRRDSPPRRRRDDRRDDRRRYYDSPSPPRRYRRRYDYDSPPRRRRDDSDSPRRSSRYRDESRRRDRDDDE